MRSQNCSKLLTLRHRPSVSASDTSPCSSFSGSGSSSSRSMRNRDLGSSGKRGIKHRSGKVGSRPRPRNGSAALHRCCEEPGIILCFGKKAAVSYSSHPGTLRKPCAGTALGASRGSVPLLAPPNDSDGAFGSSTVSSTWHHHFISLLSSNTCFRLFSTLPGKRY